MERHIAALDWAATAIGPREGWSPALKTTVKILLANGVPMMLWWGPKYTFIYNDACIPILGQKHPGGLGKPAGECWSEIRDVLHPLIDSPFFGGPSTWSEDIELHLNRSGFTEEAHFTIACGPVPDETVGRGIGGVLATMHEITAKVVGQRRWLALRELSSAVEAKSAEEACRTAAGKLAAHPKDIPFALIYLCEENGTALLAGAAGVENASALAPLSLKIADSSSVWPLDRAYETGQIQYVDLSARFPNLPAPAALRDGAVIPFRSHRPHKIAGFLIAGLSPWLPLDESYTDFLKLVASQISSAISTSVAYEEDRRCAEALLPEIVTGATAIVGAQLGVLQLKEGNRLRVAAQTGHDAQFLEAISTGDTDGFACGRAFNSERRVVAHDVEADSRFTGAKALEAMRAAGIRAVQSTPLFSRGGKILGILTTQWKTPYLPDENELGRLDVLMLQAADLIERSAGAELPQTGEERMAPAIDAAGMGTWNVDLQTGATTWSRRQFEILGYKPDNASTLLWRSRIHPNDLDAVDEAMRNARASGEPYASEHRILRADNGEVRWVAEFGRYTQYPGGEPRRFAGISLDITDRIQASRNSLLLGAIVDSSDDAIISKNLDGVITSWNKSAQRLFGYTAEEAVGQTVAALLIPAERQDEEPDILARLARGERVDHFEAVRRRKDGSLLDLSLTISPVKDGRGRIIGASKIARDITERKQREARLRSSEERFRALVTASSDAVYQMSGDWTEMRSLVGREFIADTLEPSTAWLDKYILPEDQPRVKEAIEAAIRNRSVFALEHRIIRADGTPGWTLSRAAPIMDDAGAIVEWFGAASDITDLRTAGKALQASEEHFRQLAEAGPQIVWLSNGKGELDFVNQRWVAFSGLDLAATKDPGTAQSRLHPDDDVLAKWWYSVSTATPFELEARLKSKDGEFRWFMMRSVPVMDQSGRVQRWFGTSTDIHESKMLQLELRRANQALEQFAYSASHDLQEPLRSIRIFSDMLFKRCGARFDGQELEFLEYVRDGATRMELLVRDLLSYTQASKTEKPSAPVDAGMAFEAALENLAGAIAETKATIEADALPGVYVGATQLTQLFQNLIGNALKYRRPEAPPLVQTSAAKVNGNWMFSVKDNGIGIEPEFKERIFGLFKRLHTRDEYSGTGIGLAICQRIVESHGGRIWVESRPGEGSTFRFTIPI